MNPYQQGSHDGMCGLYSIVNAMATLHSQGGHDLFENLFNCLVKSIDPEPFRNYFINGMNQKDLKKSVKAAVAFMNQQKCGTFSFNIENPSKRIDSYYNFLAKALNEVGCEKETKAAIIGMEGKFSHWTCIESATKDTLNVKDGGMKVIRRRDATTARNEKLNVLNEIFILKRIKN